MSTEKFIVPHNDRFTKRGQRREYPQIRINLLAYAHVCEMADESSRSLTDIASRAIDYAYEQRVYEAPKRDTRCDDLPLMDSEFTTSDPGTLEQVRGIIRRSCMTRQELNLLLSTVDLLPGYYTGEED